MNNTEQQQYNLPASEQLLHFYCLRHILQERPEDVSDEDKKAFCLLVLGTCPVALGINNDVTLVQKLMPEEWDRYCEHEFGPIEDLRKSEEERLIEQGWERGPDGEMYIPFP